MKNTKNHDAVLVFIKATPNLTFDSIKEGNPKISDIMLKKVIKDLQDEGLIEPNTEDGGYVFIGPTKKTETKTEKKGEKKETPPVETKTTKKKGGEDDLGPKTISGRDNSKYNFDGQEKFSKGRLVLAVLQKYASEHKQTSLSKLQEVFDSEKIQPRYGVLREISAAKKTTKNGRERYFFKQDDQIKIGKETAVCTNQWGLSAITPLIKIIHKIGYKVTVSK